MIETPPVDTYRETLLGYLADAIAQRDRAGAALVIRELDLLSNTLETRRA